MGWRRTHGTRADPGARVAALLCAALLGPAATPGWIVPATATAGTSAATGCLARARGLDEISVLLSAPAGEGLPAPSGTVVPEGTPADAATRDAIAAVVAEWLACQNAGEPLRAWGLFTDDYLRRLLLRQGAPTPAGYAALATPSPAAPDARSTLLAIRDARMLPDGRAGATVTLAYPSVPTPKTFFFTFARVDGRWLIDGILGEITFAVP